MRKFRTAVSVVIMGIAGVAGLFVGGLLQEDGMGGAVLFSLIAGLACLIYTVDNPET